MRRSYALRQFAAQVLAVAFLSIALLTVCHAGDKTDKPVDPQLAARQTEAARLVDLALAAEARGEATLRQTLLDRAVKTDPDCAAAHWQLGQVRIADEWRGVDEAIEKMKSSGAMAEYRTRRDQSVYSADSQVKLARWCGAAGLKEQERTHYLFAGYLKPTERQTSEIMTKLDLTRRRGVLMPRAQADQMDRQSKDDSAALADWKTKFIGVNRNLNGADSTARKSALDQIRAIRNPAVVPLLENMLSGATDETADAIVTALVAMPEQASTDALVRYSVFGKQDSLRAAAAEGLKARSYYAYMPTLLLALQMPVEVSFEVGGYSQRSAHRLTLYQEGPIQDKKVVSDGGSLKQINAITHIVSGAPSSFSTRFIADSSLTEDSQRAAVEAAANQQREEQNQLIVAALRAITGIDMDNDPRSWWSWWYGYNEVYQAPYRPLVELRRNTYPNVPAFTTFNVSCFVAGTAIWTSTGPMAVEKVRVGESVLSQDPETGELAFKAVLATTVRPPSELVEVDAGGTTIRVTRGHPFWVDGVGWQMAKELKAGQYLHSPSGPVRIERAEEKGQAECYNLVVADFASYFVSDAKVLVHDNNLRQVTTAIVPGLVK